MPRTCWRASSSSQTRPWGTRGRRLSAWSAAAGTSPCCSWRSPAPTVSRRARVGFATYFHPGWLIDHVIAEVWDPVRQRWRLVDPELADDHVAAVDGARIDPEDIPPGGFLTGPEAWRSCRSGAIDVQRFVVAPELGLPATRGGPTSGTT